MNVLDSAHRLGHEYPGGAGVLADRLGINRSVFNSKLNPTVMTHHLTLMEALRMQQLAGKAEILLAMADELGYVAIPLPQIGEDHEQVSMALAKACAEFGDYMREVNAAMSDGTVTPNEAKRLERELSEMIGAATHLQGLLVGMAKSVK